VNPLRYVKLDLIEYVVYESSMGNICLVAKNGRLIALEMKGEDEYKLIRSLTLRYPESLRTERPFKKVRLLLDRYLRGQKVDFDIPVDVSAETRFTQKVLRVLQGIPYGEARSYLWVGRQIGYTMAARAIGQAVKRNPIPIIIPCHRVIREDGSIGGFSQGVNIKRRLLAIEKVELPRLHR
jgi:methylated-DNA-[protein]-cysteine S-methyltransferase